MSEFEDEYEDEDLPLCEQGLPPDLRIPAEAVIETIKVTREWAENFIIEDSLKATPPDKLATVRPLVEADVKAMTDEQLAAAVDTITPEEDIHEVISETADPA